MESGWAALEQAGEPSKVQMERSPAMANFSAAVWCRRGRPDCENRERVFIIGVQRLGLCQVRQRIETCDATCSF